MKQDANSQVKITKITVNDQDEKKDDDDDENQGSSDYTSGEWTRITTEAHRGLKANFTIKKG